MPGFDDESGIRRLIDEADVAQVILRYARGVDERDWDAVWECFDADGYIVGTFGEGTIRDYLPSLIGRVEGYGATMHLMANQIREIDGDTARTETYGIAHHFSDAAGEIESLIVGMCYLDRLSRGSNGAWRIVHREARTMWARRADDVPA